MSNESSVCVDCKWLPDGFAQKMMFPGGMGSSELQQAAAEKVKKDIGTFVIFGFIIEAGKSINHLICAECLHTSQDEPSWKWYKDRGTEWSGIMEMVD
ncbi:unnamed protein product [Nippostrongylus brasiliensis]|uniref:Protein yippee-like n=1 Tax=Nippostrongylus brasiliensis TaxID=27835 RepID=A0A0N4XJS6_NIPBR|nr:unnamed protein product [Nippostrongylus brasiliensis]